MTSTNTSSAQPNLAAQRRKLEFAPPPIAFVPNRGQTDPKVRLVARGLGGMLFFADDEIVLAIAQAPRRVGPAQAAPADPTPRPRQVLRIRYEGANKTPQIEPAEALATRTSYYIGDDPAKWQRNLVSYAATVYRQLYPGIDLRFDGPSGRLKSTYTVAPGADPTTIRWRYGGGVNPRLDTAGNLLVDLPTVSDEITATGELTGTLTEAAPVAWQTIDGQRVSVPVRFVVEPGQRVGFAVGAYDHSQPLVIDPTFSMFLGGSGSDQGNDIAVDVLGNSYVVGTTSSTNFPASNGIPGTGDRGGTDIFVTKHTPSGTLYASTYFGGDSNDVGNGIAIDNTFAFQGGVDIEVVGSTDSTNFPTLNARHSQPLGSQDAVAVRIFDNNLSGQFELLTSTYLGGSGNDVAYDVAMGYSTSSAADAFIVGTTTSSDFTNVQNALKYIDAFVLRLRANGTTVGYSRFIGGDDREEGYDIAVDSNDNAYITGLTLSSTGFAPLNAAQATYGGAYDAYITKLAPNGVPSYNSYFGGTDQEIGYGIALIGQSAYITGHTKSLVLPGTAGKYQQACASGSLGCNDVFVTRYTSVGALQWSTYLGGNNFEYGQALAIAADGTAYVTGYTSSGNFPTAYALQADLKSVYSDVFISAIDGTGTKLLNSTYLGGISDDYGYGIAVDANSSIYLAGKTLSSDFPTFDVDYPLSYGGNYDAFVAKMSGTIGFEFLGPFPPSGSGDASADKPQSKLWWNDGIWWGLLLDWSAIVGGHYIHQLTWPNEWVRTTTLVDPRAAARADVLWDNVAKKLYVVSVIPGEVDPSNPVPSNNDVRLYRYSYTSATKSYGLDAGFPKVVMNGKSETMTIAKDTTGKLWVAYTSGNQVWYQVSTDDGLTWSARALIPNAPDVSVSYDDIAAVIAFDGKIGVLWSDHNPKIADPNATYRFSYRDDSSPIGTWQPATTAALPPGACASDDHINMKTDTSGRLYVAAKTSFGDNDVDCTGTSTSVQLMLLVRQTNGTWSWTSFATKADGLTRPAILIDSTNNKLYMFASPEPGGIVYMKSTDLSNPSFVNQPGKGTPFISSGTYQNLNNSTTTKQSVNGSTNLVVVATNQVGAAYMHNVIDLPGQAPVGATYTFGPAADTYVSQASATSNYAASTTFSIVGGASSEKQAFLRFTVSGLPVGATVQSAKLRLYVTNDSTSGGTFTKVTNTTWAETITWNTKPAIDGAVLATLGAVALNTSYEVDVIGAITGNGTYSFAITLPSSNTNTLAYASREATTTANRPQLIITTQ